MRVRKGLVFLFATSAVVLAAGVFAQTPHIVNAAVDQRTVSGDLGTFFDGLVREHQKPAWIGYSVPAIPGHNIDCCGGCGEDSGSTRYLEGRNRSTITSSDTTLRLEGNRTLVVLARAENGRLDRLRLSSPECTLDAGGLPFTWLTGVNPAQSVSLMSRFARTRSESKKVSSSAFVALSMHAEPSALDALIDLARKDPDAEVRGQALFWLSQKAGEKAVQTLTDAVRNDPDTEVKTRAVFALSQLPKDEGVPLLIQVARNNTNPQVRKRAMFWLGQSKDPRAVAFFEEILKSK